MKAFILGIDHDIQYQDDRGQLRAIVSELCDSHQVDLIAEEWRTSKSNNVRTIGREVATERLIAWTNIEISERIREKLGILRDLNRRSQPIFYPELRQFVTEIPNYIYLPRADCIREHRWLRKIVRFKSHKSVLVMCGLIHVKPFATKLMGASFEVLTASLCEYQWYRARISNQCVEVEKELKDEQY